MLFPNSLRLAIELNMNPLNVMAGGGTCSESMMLDVSARYAEGGPIVTSETRLMTEEDIVCINVSGIRFLFQLFGIFGFTLR